MMRAARFNKKRGTLFGDWIAQKFYIFALPTPGTNFRIWNCYENINKI